MMTVSLNAKYRPEYKTLYDCWQAVPCLTKHSVPLGDNLSREIE